MRILFGTLLAACLCALPVSADAAPGARQKAARAGCMCNEDSFAATPCARRGARRMGPRERRARAEIQRRIDQTIAADKAEDVEAAVRFNTADFTAKTVGGRTLTRQQVKEHIQRNHNFIISVSDRTRVIIDCLVLEGDNATVYINQHFVRTVPIGADRKPRELVTNVTHREDWVRTRRGWMRSFIEELESGPFFLDGKRMNPNRPFDPEAPPYDPRDPNPRKPLADALYATAAGQGIEQALRQYRELKGSKEYYVTEVELNALGYRLLREKKVAEAVEIFKLNAEAYPHSSNVHDSLGEAYAAAGLKALAVSSYQRSLELNPQNTNAVEMLKKLREN